MKRFLTLLVCMALILSLAACGSAKSGSLAADKETAAAYTALLQEMQQTYHPGTAGSSLSGAAYAAKLADFFSEHPMASEDIIALTKSFYEGLSDDEAAFFPQQTEGIASSYAYLVNGGEGLLEDCGYAPEHRPWSEDVRACMDILIGWNS